MNHVRDRCLIATVLARCQFTATDNLLPRLRIWTACVCGLSALLIAARLRTAHS